MTATNAKAQSAASGITPPLLRRGGRSAGLLAHLMEELENPQGQKIWDMILEQDDSAECAGIADPDRADSTGEQK